VTDPSHDPSDSPFPYWLSLDDAQMSEADLPGQRPQDGVLPDARLLHQTVLVPAHGRVMEISKVPWYDLAQTLAGLLEVTTLLHVQAAEDEIATTSSAAGWAWQALGVAWVCETDPREWLESTALIREIHVRLDRPFRL